MNNSAAMSNCTTVPPRNAKGNRFNIRNSNTKAYPSTCHKTISFLLTKTYKTCYRMYFTHIIALTISFLNRFLFTDLYKNTIGDKYTATVL